MRQIYESALVHVSCSAGKLSLSTRRPPLHTRYITPLFVAAEKMMVKFVGGHLETKEIARLRIWWQRQVTAGIRKKTRPLRFSLDWAGYLSISNLGTNPTAPNVFWGLTFRKSVRNQLPTRESLRQVRKSREIWQVCNLPRTSANVVFICDISTLYSV